MIRGQRGPGLQADLSIRSHHLISDVSNKLGGLDLGPTPHELLEAALAACTIITVQMYANQKKWPLTSTEVDVRVEFENQAPDNISQISRQIKFNGDLSVEQKNRLREIAEKCPIHRLLESRILIQTTALT